MQTFRKINEHRCPWNVMHLFIAKVKNIPSTKVMFDCSELSEAEQEQIESMIVRYEAREPVSKILNKREFWTSEFFVNKDVLDPRPETEFIVEETIRIFDQNQTFRFLDIGTGSGCILLSIAKEFPNSQGVGIDINPKSVTVALRNKEHLQIKNVIIKNISWNDFEGDERFDLIVSNPPYIKTDDIMALDDNVKNYDPYIALDGGKSGLDAYKQLSLLIKNWIKPNGIIMLEIGFDQYTDVRNIFEYQGFKFAGVCLDLQGIKRVIKFNTP